MKGLEAWNCAIRAINIFGISYDKHWIHKIAKVNSLTHSSH